VKHRADPDEDHGEALDRAAEVEQAAHDEHVRLLRREHPVRVEINPWAEVPEGSALWRAIKEKP